jgi:DMSO reductase anchor subunit
MTSALLVFFFACLGMAVGFVLAVATYVYMAENTSIQMPRDELSVPGVSLSLLIIAFGLLGAYIGWRL